MTWYQQVLLSAPPYGSPCSWRAWGNAALNFLFWWHEQVLCLTGKENSPLGVTENVLLVILLSEQDRKKQWRTQCFQTWDLLACWGWFLILLVPCQSGLCNPAIYSFFKSSVVIPLAPLFFPKWWLENLRCWNQNAKYQRKVCFDLCGQSVDFL